MINLGYAIYPKIDKRSGLKRAVLPDPALYYLCSFIFAVCVKSVPRYDFIFACVIFQMAVKEFLETHIYKWRYRPF